MECQEVILKRTLSLECRHAASIRGRAVREEQSQQDEAESESLSQEGLSNGVHGAHSNGSQPEDAQGYVSV